VSLGTVSKSLAPALRLGWALVPEALVEPVAAIKQVVDRGVPTLDQLALAALIESGRYDRHLRRMRTTYSQRREALVAALAAHAPARAVTGLAAGFHAVTDLPPGADEEQVVARALELRVRLYGMGSYRSNPAGAPPRLVFGFGNTGVRAIEEGIRTVAPLLR
jgi:GntR family transcriptional regulator/MocR family aminotransferase